jgi:protein PhnA
MNTEQTLRDRSNNTCELCGATESLSVYEVPPPQAQGAEGYALICSSCREQIEYPEKVDANHWRCLNDSMWSQVPAVQVLAWRMLNRLRAEGWPQALLDMLYLDDEILSWARALGDGDPNTTAVQHLDSNGNVLESGDTVTLIQDLNVKGANFTAKRGTAVRRISLVADNPEQVEGRVNGQQIVILTKYVKKSK